MLSLRRILAHLLLLAACLTQRAAAEFIRADTEGSLVFSVEQHLSTGEHRTVVIKLTLGGAFTLYGSPQNLRGELPGAEGRHILEAFEKLCIQTGVDFAGAPPPRQPPAPPFLPIEAKGTAAPATYITDIRYHSPRGQILEFTRPPPAPLTDFLHTLWHKLQDHLSKHPGTPAQPILR